MLTTKLCTVLILSFCVGAFCSVSRTAPGSNKSEDHEGHCSYKGELIKQGEGVDKHCFRISCNDDYSIEEAQCGVYDLAGCKKTKLDATKVYPDCCEPICIDA